MGKTKNYWTDYLNLTNYEILEKECGTDPKVFDPINLNIDYWGMEDNGIDEDKEE